MIGQLDAHLGAYALTGGAPRGRWRTGEPCRNCGDPATANYCPTCGQKKVDVRVRLRDLVAELLDDQFSVNGRLPRTIAALLVKPGRLTSHYIDGRIARYVQPFRMYLIWSVIFFLLLSLRVGYGGAFELDDDVIHEPAVPTAPGVVPGAGWADDITINTPWPAVTRLLEERRARLNRLPPHDALRAVGNELLSRIPIMMFVLLPVFALLLKILYIRRQRYYVEHFIFALHFHALVFAVLAINLAAGMRLTAPAWLWILAYLFLALRHVYGQSVLRTLAKYMIIAWSYALILALGIASTAIVAILLV